MNISIDIAAKDGMTREDVLDAVKKSCEEYVRTEDGKRTYDCNCGAFNYGDFDVYVPNEICKKYGIEKGMHVSEMIGGGLISSSTSLTSPRSSGRASQRKYCKKADAFCGQAVLCRRFQV